MAALTLAQMVLANADAIEHGVRRITGPAGLGADVTADLIGDATLALLDKRGQSFDPERGNPAAFCRMVAYQVALDMLRAMNRGGQYSGAYAGFANAELDSPGTRDGADSGPVRRAPARNAHKAPTGRADDRADSGRAVRVRGEALATVAGMADECPVERIWLTRARAAVAAVLPSLTDAERELFAELESGDHDPPSYAERHGIAVSAAYVRANRLRAKVRDLLAEG